MPFAVCIDRLKRVKCHSKINKFDNIGASSWFYYRNRDQCSRLCISPSLFFQVIGCVGDNLTICASSCVV